jgi:vitamin B12 transporter
MKKEINVWAMTMIACWFWLPPQAKAQQDSLSSTTLREVVITATKYPKHVSETGKVLSIIDEEQLSRSAGKDLSQLLNEQVGLVINGANSNPAKDKSVFIRGAAGKYTLLLIDGVPVNDPSGIDGSFDLRLLAVDQIERIEILKGSQSTLYGSDAIAGVINIITKKKGDKPISGTGLLTYGSYNTVKGNATVSGSTEKFDYNLGYTLFQTDGISEAKDPTGSNSFDKDGGEQQALQFNLGYRPTEHFSIRPFLRLTNFNGDYDLGAFTDDPGARYDATALQYGVNTDYQFKKGSITLMYAYNKNERTFKDMFGSYDYDGRFSHGEMYGQFNLSDHVQLVGGAAYQNFNMVATNTTIQNPETTIISPFLSFFVNDLSGFSAEVGGRFNGHSVYGKNLTYSLNPSYLINKIAKLFFNYSTGFKAPTLSQLYGPFGANEDLKPEESTSVEAGLQWMGRGGKLDARVTYFRRKIDNVIVFTTGYVNLDKLDDQGVEVEVYYKLNKFTFTGFYAFVEGEITTPVGAGMETTPNALIRRPKHSVGLNIAMQATKKLFTSLNFKTFGQRNDLYFDFNTFTTSPVVLEAYQLLDVYVEYTLVNNRLKLFGDLRNLLDQKYYEVYGYSTQQFNATVGIRLGI